MYHSITFEKENGGKRNTWDSWHLIPTSRPVMNPPALKENYVDIPGGYGSLDLTVALRGVQNFDDRTGSVEFIVMHDYWKSWIIAYNTIADWLHGVKVKAFLEDDPWYYYEGRWTINQWKSDEHYSLITLDYRVYPFKKERYSSAEPWLWDPFDFENGVIRQYDNIEVVESGTTVKIPGTREQIVPAFIVDGMTSPEIMLDYGTKHFTLNEGYNIFPEVHIESTTATLTFRGTGRVTIDYRGGKL